MGLNPYMDAVWAHAKMVDAEIERRIRAGDYGWLEVPEPRILPGPHIAYDAFIWHPAPLEPTRTTNGGTASFYDLTDQKARDACLLVLAHRNRVIAGLSSKERGP